MVQFTARGHHNIKATHRSTIEFTKKSSLTVHGDCILGVKADYNTEALQRLVQSAEKLRIRIRAGDISDELEAESNPGFMDDEELVIRMGEFTSERTLGVRATKGAQHISRALVKRLQLPAQKIEVNIEKAIE